MAPLILITGATGYIGGTILSTLLETGVSKESISVLVRGHDKADALEKLGVKTILFNSLDDSDALRAAASLHDVVIHTASGFHPASAVALIQGLGDRKKTTGKYVHYIHTSGTSNLGDQPITGAYLEDRVFSDKENIFAYEKTREALAVYASRTADIAVVETGLALGVQTHIIMSPTIYGIGKGLFNKQSIQVPALIRNAIQTGHAEVVGEGTGIWDYVHVVDLAKLYALLVSKIGAGENVPTGEQGIIFSGTGRYQWRDLVKHIAEALFQLKAIPSPEVKSIDLKTAAERWTGGQEFYVELGFASNARTQSDVAKELGWQPEKTDEDFKKHFIEEANLIIG